MTWQCHCHVTVCQPVMQNCFNSLCHKCVCLDDEEIKCLDQGQFIDQCVSVSCRSYTTRLHHPHAKKKNYSDEVTSSTSCHFDF